jgi:hypothetical protein
MKSANILGLATYIIAWGFIMSLFTDNYELMRQLGAVTLGAYLIFIITQNYEHEN